MDSLITGASAIALIGFGIFLAWYGSKGRRQFYLVAAFLVAALLALGLYTHIATLIFAALILMAAYFRGREHFPPTSYTTNRVLFALPFVFIVLLILSKGGSLGNTSDFILTILPAALIAGFLCRRWLGFTK